jgi:hypothetical protein
MLIAGAELARHDTSLLRLPRQLSVVECGVSACTRRSNRLRPFMGPFS